MVIFPLVLSAEESVLTGPGPTVIEKKSLSRIDDYVVMRGEKLKHGLNNDIAKFSLFANIEGKFQPVPFQIDEMNPDGEWVLTQVPPEAKKSVKPDRDDDDGNLDGNDELAFMVRDAGDRVSFNGLPAGVMSIDEITLRDPADNGKAWVYLLSFRENPPLSKKDYVEYKLPENQVVAKNYVLGFDPRMSIAPSLVSMFGSANIIDRMKVRLSTKIMGIPFGFDESNLVSELSLYKDGPIRVVRRVRSSIQFTRIFRTPSAAVENVYYDNTMVIPIRVKMPISLKSFSSIVSYARVRGAVDLQNIKGWKIRLDTDPRWMSVDGKMDEVEKNIKGEGMSWFLISGPEGAFMFRLVLNRKPDGSFQKSPIQAHQYYVDDDTSLDPPEFVPGQSPQVGWLMENLADLEKGTLYLFPIMFMIRDYKEGMEKNYLKILDQPVEVTVN
ncbi:MAG: hypothetical protein NT056_07510 [Proteobacteria bacterium]|nr:hypothetical protein [Pseudomonadota bacterium]